MAERKIAFNIAFKKNDNQYNAGYGQYYPEAYSGSVLSLRGLIERVAFDQSVYSRDIIEGVITKLRDSMVELLQSGQPGTIKGTGHLASPSSSSSTSNSRNKKCRKT